MFVEVYNEGVVEFKGGDGSSYSFLPSVVGRFVEVVYDQNTESCIKTLW